MKKIFVTIIALLAVSFSLCAQRKAHFSKDVEMGFGNDVFRVEPISYLGYGYHLWNDDMKQTQNVFNSEFFVNIMELSLRPARFMAFNLGVDYDLDTYRLDKKTAYWTKNELNDTPIVHPLSMSPYSAVKYSRMRVHTFSIPLSLEFSVGKCAFRVGAAGEYNLPANIKNRLVAKDGNVKQSFKGIKTRELTYSAFGAISYGGLGVYVRYRPVSQFEEGDIQFKSLTIGAAIGLGF